jgi:predicted glycosyltransferase
VYDWARRHGRPQAFIVRDRKDRTDQVAWLAAWAPAVDTVFLLGHRGYTTTRHGVTIEGVSDVMRQPLDNKSVWTDTTHAIRVAISAAGGGHHDGENFVDVALRGVAMFAADTGRTASVFVVLGPNFAGRVSVPAMAGASVTVVGYLDPWHSLYQDTDLVICQAGYNTVQELLHYRTPAVSVPGARPYDDQHARLAGIPDVPYIRVAHPDPASIATQLAVVSAADRPVEAPNSPPDGAQEIANHLATRQASSAFGAWLPEAD